MTHSIVVFISIVIGYILLIKGIHSDKEGAGQSFASYMLWLVLDIIMLLGVLKGHANPVLYFTYSVGTAFVVVWLAIQKKYSWSSIETMTLILVAICVYVYFSSDARHSIVASCVSIDIAGVPLMIKIYREPNKVPIKSFILFVFGSLVLVSSAPSCDIEHLFSPLNSMCINLSFLLIVLFRRTEWSS